MTAPERRRLGADVPALVWRAREPGPRPALVFVHGGRQSKEVVGPRTVERALGAGVTLVAVDAYLHGEHLDGSGRVLGDDYALLLEIVEHTARDLEAVAVELAADAAIEADAIGVRGDSLGAYAALTALGRGAGFSVAVSAAGAAGFETTLAHALRAHGAPEEAIVAEQERLGAWIREFDPLLRADRIAPRPLLLVHGLADDLVPIAAHRALYDALVPHYAAAPDDCVFLVHAGGHVTPAAVDELAWRWQLDRLVRQPRRRRARPGG